uniref:E3 ubiquitin-protein ligase n=1 Tax=Timema monikensis TaxID=170555 RepID=A0A7R9EEL1_9NEOP|nr:unnamed protein product [Timema monikensis]
MVYGDTLAEDWTADDGETELRISVGRGDVRDDVRKSVLSSLECPVCMEYIAPPITLCQNGHNICSCCRKKMFRCPVCEGQFLSVRNRALEDIAAAIEYPCRFSHLGCDEAYPMDRIGKHHSKCPHRVYSCFFDKLSVCGWKGRRQDIKRHVLDAHEKSALDLDDGASSCVSWEVPNSNCYRDSLQVIFCLGEVFLYLKRFDDSRKKLFVLVRYVGGRSAAARYRYKLKLRAPDGTQKASFCSTPVTEMDETERVFEAGECVVVDFDLLLRFVKGVKTMKILRVDDVVTEL